MNNIILETKNLSFNNQIDYQDIKIIKDKVNFVVGASGTGKSTLLRLLNGTLSSSSGEIYYQSTNILEMDTIELRKEVTLISQSVFLFDSSIRENFKSFYEYRQLDEPTDEIMMEYLQLSQISFPLDKDCTRMSVGEKQRVYIAIFLSFLPKVIMMDEPTSALDKDNGYNVIQNVIKFCKSKDITVIIISHDNHLTETFGENIIRIGKEGVNEQYY